MKIEVINKSKMVLTGKKVLNLIQDNHTPPVDLFVREVLQNCGDAALDDKEYVKVDFNVGTFNNLKLYHLLDGIRDNLFELYGESNYQFISVSDTNTVGLIGSHNPTQNSTNHLYNLVYDVMNTKVGDYKGGSWGIGKSVYYRYGIGLCFYYSRCFENGKYVSKLAGVLIQDEEKQSCLLGKGKSGIAFFGDSINGNTCPIYDEKEIKEFLSIFGLKPYDNQKTGTTVIIPYFDSKKFLDIYNSNDQEMKPYWVNNVEECLEASIKRWYFPRLNNKKYNGKYFVIGINRVKVEVESDPFYKTMQDIYNGEGSFVVSKKIEKKGFQQQPLGVFNYAIVSKENLGIETPPYNYPKLNTIIDSTKDCENKGLLTYLRRPGMIITYNDSCFGEYDKIPTDKYLIGIFKLNDDCTVDNENLGQYIRKTEKANHGEWQDLSISEDFNTLISLKPFKNISKKIKNILSDLFKNEKTVTVSGSSTVFQKKLAKLFLPEEGYGLKPSPPKLIPPKPISSKQIHNYKLEFSGFTDSGELKYTVHTKLKEKRTIIFNSYLKTGSKSISVVEWQTLNFELPYKVTSVKLTKFIYDQFTSAYENIIPYCGGMPSVKASSPNNKEVFKFSKLESKEIYGFEIENLYNSEIELFIEVLIKPLDNKYTLDFKVEERSSKNEN